MVKMVSDGPSGSKGERIISFKYDRNNAEDVAILEKFHTLCSLQKRCDNCAYFYREGGFGGYQACSCKIHGCLEVAGHPHYDMDGSKCEDYSKIENR